MMEAIVSLNEVRREWFSCDESFEAFKLAATKAWRLQSMLDDGYFVVYADRYVMSAGRWEVYYDKSDGPVVAFNFKGCRTIYAGCKWDDDDLCVVSKAEVRQEFSLLRVAAFVNP